MLRSLENTFARIGRGWRYITGQMTVTDAYVMRAEAHTIIGIYPLEQIDVTALEEDAVSRWGEHPDMRRFCEQAAKQIDARYDQTDAQDSALELVPEFAARAGVTLTEAA